MGSLVLPRLDAARRNPLRAYAALETATAICGVLVFSFLPVVERVYLAAAAHGFANMALRGVICGFCLFPPTFFMGATLAVISRSIAADADGVLYASNIAGGVIGCFGAGFYLLRVHDMAFANAAAVALNTSRSARASESGRLRNAVGSAL